MPCCQNDISVPGLPLIWLIAAVTTASGAMTWAPPRSLITMPTSRPLPSTAGAPRERAALSAVGVPPEVVGTERVAVAGATVPPMTVCCGEMGVAVVMGVGCGARLSWLAGRLMG